MGWREKEATKLKDKKVLVVGAGGIGCELLKNIVLSGFRDIHVIDLDTIDVSNLNRQFLFRREHVGRAKADVATSAALKMAPDVNIQIKYDHDSIFSEKFDYDFFKQFFLVLNALDNRSARNHVNRMCMATRIPLVDGGSAGYFGQVSTMVRGRTECYECEPKAENTRSFPGCTIRNTPSEHIHCTVWAKHVFNQLFGELDVDDEVSPDLDDEEANDKTIGETANENEEAKTEKKTEEGAKSEEKPANTRALAEDSNYCPITIFNKLFVDDISYLLRMENLWKERRKPIAISFGNLPDEVAGSSSADDSAARLDPSQKMWSLAQNGAVFKAAVHALAKRKAATSDGVLVWDKDDDDAMRFVAACANIRAALFSIPTKTLFEIKSMAGNIIPAIATTNAIIAAAMTVESLKLVDDNLASLRSVTVWNQPNIRGKILADRAPEKPNPKCYTCAPKREVAVRVNLEKMNIQTLRDKILIEHLKIATPDVMDGVTNKVIISSEEGETDALLEKTLSSLGQTTGTRLLVEDFDDGAALSLCLLSAASFHGEQFEVISDIPAEEFAVKEEEEGEKQKVKVGEGKKRKNGEEAEDTPEKEADIKRARISDGEVTITA